jgi:uncharacterized OB-fold protein
MFWSGWMADAQSVPLEIRLTYQHPLGELSPYFAALREGKLLATACRKCGRTWAPPRLMCTCGCAAVDWVPLAGTGTVEHVTSTASSLPATDVRETMTFVLVRFDGAVNRALARFSGELNAARGMRIRLRSPGEAASRLAHPVQALVVEPA